MLRESLIMSRRVLPPTSILGLAGPWEALRPWRPFLANIFTSYALCGVVWIGGRTERDRWENVFAALSIAKPSMLASFFRRRCAPNSFLSSEVLFSNLRLGFISAATFLARSVETFPTSCSRKISLESNCFKSLDYPLWYDESPYWWFGFTLRCSGIECPILGWPQGLLAP